MIDRACISINNRCNLHCTYCHFHTPEKAACLVEADMDVYHILERIKNHIGKHDLSVFKLGFVGNGEPLLEYEALQGYIACIADHLADGRIAAYTITNGTLVTEDMLRFFQAHRVSVGFSIDGIAGIHNKYRCDTHAQVMKAIRLYHRINGQYPPMNCTVSRDVLDRAEETIAFFAPFGSRITFSRMIGTNGVSLDEFHRFLAIAGRRLDVRTGGYDCTMYGGKCGAGINNVFYANGKVYLCGNCVDLKPVADAGEALDNIKPDMPFFDRNICYREAQRFPDALSAKQSETMGGDVC